ncbi:MAG: efflux RND transporter periplasmic adaptor subunit [Isosphaeraceae bacterium]|nr:efflux RND transporter periplasmic adaptor subunit [Isosphaeraceae bacterium]
MTTGGGQQITGADPAFQRPKPSVAEGSTAAVHPSEQVAPRTAEKPRARGRGRTILRWLLGAAAAAASVLGYLYWEATLPEKLPDGFTSANGRIEATEIDVATKLQNRIAEVIADDGDYVSAGQVVAKMDLSSLSAELREDQAQHRLAKSHVETARATIMQREDEKQAAESVVALHEARLVARSKHHERIKNLTAKGSATEDELDVARADYLAEKAEADQAKAKLTAAVAAVSTAKSQLIEAEAAVDAAKAKCERIQADIDDSSLKAPRNGRVQYRIAQAGEVLYPGGKVLNMVDLSDVYMTFFLPDALAGRVKIGAETRLVLDAAPQYVIPAQVTMIADVAQFTPKTVETALERQKLTFRLKAKIDKDVLKSHLPDVKTGLPGVAYVRIDPSAEWPERLRVKLPPPSSPPVPPRQGPDGSNASK